MVRRDPRRLLLLVVFVLASCTRIMGTGEIVTIEVPVESFNRLEVSSSFVVNVSIGETPSLTLSVDRAVEDHLLVGVVDDTLRIGIEPRTLLAEVTLEAEVVVPSLEAIQGSGASEIHVADLPSPALEIELSGASTLDGTVDSDVVTIELSGASTLAVNGQAGQLQGDVSGASHLSVIELSVVAVDVDLSGASSAEVNVSESLVADLSGASSLRFRGEAVLVQTSTSGASSVERLSSN